MPSCVAQVEMDVWPRVAVAVILGLLFGTITTLLNTPPGDYVLDDSPRRVASLVVNSGAAWAAMAVLGGWLVASTLRGLIAGPVVLILAVASYYLVGAVAGSENADGSLDQVTYFGLVALVAGPLLGAVGGEIRRRDLLGLVSALVVPLAVYAETIWRASTVQVQPDPARPAADMVLVTLATAGVTIAVGRNLIGRRSRGRETTERLQVERPGHDAVVRRARDAGPVGDTDGFPR